MLGLAAVPAVILFLGVLRLPESPRFLIKTGHPDQARQVLSSLRSGQNVDAEMDTIQSTAKQEASATKSTSMSTLIDHFVQSTTVECSTSSLIQQLIDTKLR